MMIQKIRVATRNKKEVVDITDRLNEWLHAQGINR